MVDSAHFKTYMPYPTSSDREHGLGHLALVTVFLPALETFCQEFAGVQGGGIVEECGQVHLPPPPALPRLYL